MKYRKILSQIMRCSSFIFKENHAFIEEENPGADIDGIGINLDGWNRLSGFT